LKLLFDHNLSLRLVKLLLDLFPGSTHVSKVGLSIASDREVWDYAAATDFLIITKDADFNDLSIILGFPPRLIWIRRGNCSTTTIEALIRTNYATIQGFETNPDAGILTLL